MIRKCGEIAFGLLIICLIAGREPAKVFASQMNREDSTKTREFTEEGLKLAQIWKKLTNGRCDMDESAYEEVYSFETQNSRISICRLGESFFYHRQSKFNPNQEILIPAMALSSGSVFQAQDGKVTYFVGKSGDRYYSSVMKNNDEIVFEPELESVVPEVSEETLLNRNRHISRRVKPRSQSNSISEVESSFTATLLEPDDSELICTRESSKFHPQLQGWQKLIGRTTRNVNRYAANHGHDFIYDRQIPEFAQINSKDGATVNLSITDDSEIVEEVCVKTEVERD